MVPGWWTQNWVSHEPLSPHQLAEMCFLIHSKIQSKSMVWARGWWTVSVTNRSFKPKLERFIHFWACYWLWLDLMPFSCVHYSVRRVQNCFSLLTIVFPLIRRQIICFQDSINCQVSLRKWGGKQKEVSGTALQEILQIMQSFLWIEKIR